MAFRFTLNVRTYYSSAIVKTRFAPSPTGMLHLGSLRTALFNYLYAKQTGGLFFLRIEDTDQSRIAPGAVGNLLDILQWSRLIPDNLESPIVQSQRLSIYQGYGNELLERGIAYLCFCSKERLERMRLTHPSNQTKYDRHCRHIPLEEAKRRAATCPHVLRFKMNLNNDPIIVRDKTYGTMKISPFTIDDFILIKSDGYPTYHFANVLDDHLMEITTVLRGQEWIASTPLHILLYQAFGWAPPEFVHLPLLINPDGSKLSKRQNDANVSYYRQAGYLSPALLNYVALMGWTPNPGQDEVMDLTRLVNAFRIDKINKGDAIVNIDKLRWFNRHHLANLTEQPIELAKLAIRLRDILLSTYHTYCKDYMAESIKLDYLANVITVIKERIYLVDDIPKLCSYFFVDPDYSLDEPAEMYSKFIATIDIHHLERLLSWLSNKFDGEQDHFNSKDLSIIFATCREELKISSSLLMLILRWSLTGTRVGATVTNTMVVLGPKTTVRRLGNCLKFVKSLDA